MKWIKALPNLMTLANVFLGMLAILFIVESSERVEISNQLTQNFEITAKPSNFMYLGIAGYLILLAALFDFLDGFVARLLKAQSELGAQLDSLADMVTFGVAPAMIIYKLMESALAIESNGFGASTVKLWPSLLIGVSACYRLAKFNIDTEQIAYFKGIPTPASAILIISLPFILISDTIGVANYLLNYNTLLIITLVISYLMISNIPMLAFKFKNFKIKGNISRYIVLAIGITSIVLYGYIGIPLAFLTYLIISLLSRKQIIQS